MYAISSYRGNRPTHKQTHRQTGPITIHCAAELSAQCNNTARQYVELAGECDVAKFHVTPTAEIELLRRLMRQQ